MRQPTQGGQGLLFLQAVFSVASCGGLPDAHSAALSLLLLLLLNRTGGENKIEKLVGQDKEGDTTYQSPSWAKQTYGRLIYCQLK